jgi:hypothetical protein
MPPSGDHYWAVGTTLQAAGPGLTVKNLVTQPAHDLIRMITKEALGRVVPEDNPLCLIHSVDPVCSL